jgi:hypothetical protein
MDSAVGMQNTDYAFCYAGLTGIKTDWHAIQNSPFDRFAVCKGWLEQSYRQKARATYQVAADEMALG